MMRGLFEDWAAAIRSRLVDYRDVLERRDVSQDTHNRRSGLYEDDYVRPGLSIEIPLFWGTF